MTKTQRIRHKTFILLSVVLIIAMFTIGSMLVYATVEISKTQKEFPHLTNVEPPKLEGQKAYITVHHQLSEQEKIDNYIRTICREYKLEPELVMSIVYHESRYNPKAKTGDCLGLMQVSKYWHKERAIKLGVTDFYDSRSNILLGVDYLSELFESYKDPKLVLMLYNMKHETAFKLYRDGKTSYYARSVLERAENLKKGE